MIDARQEQLLSVRHDGELPPEALRQIPQGADADRYATGLVEISNLFRQSTVSGLTPAAWGRVHRRWDRTWDLGLNRLGWEMSALAAAVLLVASVGLLKQPRSTSDVSVPPWVRAQATVDPTTRESDTPAAAWYLADARGGNDLGQ